MEELPAAVEAPAADHHGAAAASAHHDPGPRPAMADGADHSRDPHVPPAASTHTQLFHSSFVSYLNFILRILNFKLSKYCFIGMTLLDCMSS